MDNLDDLIFYLLTTCITLGTICLAWFVRMFWDMGKDFSAIKGDLKAIRETVDKHYTLFDKHADKIEKIEENVKKNTWDIGYIKEQLNIQTHEEQVK